MRGIIKLAARLRAYRGRMALLGVLSLVGACFNVAEPYILSTIINGYGHGSLIGLMALYILALCAKEGIGIVYGHSVEVFNHRIIAKLRNDVFAWIITKRRDGRLPYTEGDLLTRTMNDVDAVTQVFASPLNGLVPDLLAGVLSGILLAGMDLRFLLVLCVILPGLYYATRWVNARTKRISHEMKEESGRATNYLIDILKNYVLLYIFRNKEGRVFSDHSHKMLHGSMSLSRAFSSYWALTTGLKTVCIAAVLLLAAFRIERGTLSIGSIVMLISYTASVCSPILQISRYGNQLVNANVALQRVFDLAPAQEDVLHAIDAGIDSIELENASVAFEGARIRFPDLALQKGSLTAVMGKSGSGKSTLLDVLAGFTRLSDGRLSVNGEDATASMLSYGKDIRYITQKPHLLHRTVGENIRYGGREERALWAMEAVGLEGFDLERVFVEGQNNISGGEQKRISIARGMNERVGVYLFDEPTSELDPATATHIALALRDLAGDAIVVVATHDRRFCAHADHVFTLGEEG